MILAYILLETDANAGQIKFSAIFTVLFNIANVLLLF